MSQLSGLLIAVAILLLLRRIGGRARIIWVNERPPAGMTRKLGHNVSVAGISQPEQQAAAVQFLSDESTACSLSLERDPHNEFDRNAIKVIGSWSDRKGIAHTARLGWVPRDVAAEIASKARDGPLGACLQGYYPPRLWRSVGLRIDLSTTTTRSHKPRA